MKRQDRYFTCLTSNVFDIFAIHVMGVISCLVTSLLDRLTSLCMLMYNSQCKYNHCIFPLFVRKNFSSRFPKYFVTEVLSIEYLISYHLINN